MPLQKCQSKKLLLTALLIALFLLAQLLSINTVQAADSVPKLEWSKTYGSYEGSSVEQTPDGGYIIRGVNATYSAIIRGYDEWSAIRLKVDSNGEVLQAETYRSGLEKDFSIMQTKDSGYLWGGKGEKLWLVKNDAEGNVQWNKTIPFDELGTIFQTSDGGYFSSSYYEDTSAKSIGVIYRLDSEGKLLWNKTISPDKYGVRITNAIETARGDFITVGMWNKMFWLGKFDSQGNMLVNKTYNYIDTSMNGLYLNSISKTFDNNFIISGTGDRKGWLFKVDENGEEFWHQSYSLGQSYTYFIKMVQTSDGGFAVAGGYAYSVLILKTDAFGNLLWNTTFREGDNDWANSIIATEDGFVVVGQLNHNVWAAKFSLPIVDNPSSPAVSVPEETDQMPTLTIAAIALTVAACVITAFLILTRRTKSQL
jgi:hypothetical protein